MWIGFDRASFPRLWGWFCVLLLVWHSNALAVATSGGIERAHIFEEDPEEPILLSSAEAIHVTGDGQRLVVALDSENSGSNIVLTLFDLDETGVPSLGQIIETDDPRYAGLFGMAALTSSVDGRYLYAAGPAGLAILEFNSASGFLDVLQIVSIPGANSLALNSAEDRLVVGRLFGNEGSSIEVYSLEGGVPTPTLLDSYEYPIDADLSDIALSDDGRRVFTATSIAIYDHSLSELGIISEPLVNLLEPELQNSTRNMLAVGADGQQLYVVSPSAGVFVFERDVQTGLYEVIQSVPSDNPTTIEESNFLPRALVLSADENALFVARETFFGFSTEFAALRCLDRYERSTETGLLRLAGYSCGEGSGRFLALHPQSGFVYSLATSVGSSSTQPGMGLVTAFRATPAAPRTELRSAVLPSARSNRTSSFTDASAFMTVLNTGDAEAEFCEIRTVGPSRDIANLDFSVVNPLTNLPLPETEQTGQFSVPTDGAQTLVFSIDSRSLDVDPTLLDIQAVCINADAAPSVPGVNTLLYSSVDGPVADFLSTTATLDVPGVVRLPNDSGTSLFVAAVVNIGDGDSITATPSVQLGEAIAGLEPLQNPPEVVLEVCETDPLTSECLGERAPSVTRTLAANEVVTYTVFVRGTGVSVPFIPETNRVFLLFSDSSGEVRGGSSVAIESL